MAEPRFSDPGLQNYVRDLARGRIGAASERIDAHLVWYPVINSKRVPCKAAPFTTQAQARNAARAFRDQCRAELGETE